jgi:hypothetical protein
MVALTGIEPGGYQFSSVHLELSSCVFGLIQFATATFIAPRRADVLPWCCPAAKKPAPETEPSNLNPWVEAIYINGQLPITRVLVRWWAGIYRQ